MKLNRLSSLFVIALLFSACAPAAVSSADQVGTAVAATLAAGGQEAATALPTVNGEIPTQSPQEAVCANSGLISVAYLKDDNVWLWTESGQKIQLTNTADTFTVRISDDGCLVAYSRAVANPFYDPNAEFPMPETLDELWMVKSDGSNAHALVDVNYLANLPVEDDYILSVYDFEWQPDTHNLAFNTRVLHPGVGLTLNEDLFGVATDTGVVTPLLAHGLAGSWFGFSPNGQRIALSTATNVHVVDADGSGLVSNLITFPMVITYSEYLYAPPAAWTPDSNSLMVAVPPADGLAQPQDGVFPETSLWWIPLDGTPPFEAGAVQNVWFSFSEVAFSPDASRIAYLRPFGEANSNTRELVTALSDGSNEQPAITAPEISFLAWADDNTQYLYSVNDGSLHLFLGTVQNENVQPISSLNSFPAAAAKAVWVEGSQFVLLEMGDSGGQISLMDTNGGGSIVDAVGTFPGIQFDVSTGK